MKCVIIDDDEFARLALQKIIDQIPEVAILEAFGNPLEAVNYLQENDCDIVFLDIEMPEMSGFDFLQSSVTKAQIIIVSSKSEYAAESYDFAVTDYIVKPISLERVQRAVEKAKQIKTDVLESKEEADFIFFKSKNGLEKVNLDDILYIEALADYVQIQTANGRHVILSTMKAMEQKMHATKFIRIHRSFIVAINKIDKIEDNTVTVGDKAFPVSRTHKQNLLNSINRI
jgi:DNA-binding LytR/AlgR family response regulator